MTGALLSRMVAHQEPVQGDGWSEAGSSQLDLAGQPAQQRASDLSRADASQWASGGRAIKTSGGTPREASRREGTAAGRSAVDGAPSSLIHEHKYGKPRRCSLSGQLSPSIRRRNPFKDHPRKTYAQRRTGQLVAIRGFTTAAAREDRRRWFRLPTGGGDGIKPTKP